MINKDHEIRYIPMRRTENEVFDIAGESMLYDIVWRETAGYIDPRGLDTLFFELWDCIDHEDLNWAVKWNL